MWVLGAEPREGFDCILKNPSGYIASFAYYNYAPPSSEVPGPRGHRLCGDTVERGPMPIAGVCETKHFQSSLSTRENSQHGDKDPGTCPPVFSVAVTECLSLRNLSRNLYLAHVTRDWGVQCRVATLGKGLPLCCDSADSITQHEPE